MEAAFYSLELLNSMGSQCLSAGSCAGSRRVWPCVCWNTVEPFQSVPDSNGFGAGTGEQEGKGDPHLLLTDRLHLFAHLMNAKKAVLVSK